MRIAGENGKKTVARQVSFILLLQTVYALTIVVQVSTRGTPGPDIWCCSWPIGHWSEATSVGLCLKASKAESRLEWRVCASLRQRGQREVDATKSSRTGRGRLGAVARDGPLQRDHGVRRDGGRP